MTAVSQQATGSRRRVDSHLGSSLNRPHGETPAAEANQHDPEAALRLSAIPPLRKAAIVLMSLEQSSASNLLSYLDRAAVEAVTWEIARVDRIDPEERELVLEEFFNQGLRRHYFGFDDLLRMNDDDIRRAFHPGDSRTWALALASSSPALRTKVLDSLQFTPAQSLRTALENLGPFRLADAEAAQSEIAEKFRDFSDQGVVVLPEPSGREELLA